jgi:aminoglycoside/choline kinase family phosphotransferase
VRVPRCHHAAMREGTGEFTLLLEDLAPAVQGDQLAGCTVDQAGAAAVNLAGLHGPRWCDPALERVPGLTRNGPDDAALLAELYGPATEIFVEGLGDRLSAEDAATLRACVAVSAAWALGRADRFALVHGDYRLDNLMFHDDGSVWAVDWQTLSLALPARDLAYLLGTSLAVADRRSCEHDLVAAYHQALVEHGVPSYGLGECWEDYRYAMLQGPLVAVFGFAYGTRTPRGDEMFAAMVARACAAIRDLGTLELAELG